MINVNELRIGNSIKAIGEIHKHLTGESAVIKVDARLIFDMVDAPQVAEVYEPINLNDYWFEKFGFKKVEMIFENIPMLYWRKDKLIVSYELENLFVVLETEKEAIISVLVDQVHKLQNLHFVLFGTELQTQAGGV